MPQRNRHQRSTGASDLEMSLTWAPDSSQATLGKRRRGRRRGMVNLVLWCGRVESCAKPSSRACSVLWRKSLHAVESLAALFVIPHALIGVHGLERTFRGALASGRRRHGHGRRTAVWRSLGSSDFNAVDDATVIEDDEMEK
ncbi:hypothetical protein BKA81DRAFT_402309 [Phyllosticta paracitricarpa]|uniref:Uncharacterized protein n=1 Tax=Phyllosticta paracitricarpa TaxID=2016321 RepID=A0ABR1MSV9_9PEZI